MAYRIKDWKEFQHYTNRRPTWIKLYRSILDKKEWFDLSGDDAKHLVELWLIASEDKELLGNLPDLPTIAFRLRMPEAKAVQMLTRLCNFVVQVDSELLSSCYQVDSLEKRREREETEREKIASLEEIPFEQIIQDLNGRINSRFRHTSEDTRKAIRARWAEGWRLPDFQHVHAIKAEEWTGTNMEIHLNPDTLYRKSKFEKYVNQRPDPLRGQSNLVRNNAVVLAKLSEANHVAIEERSDSLDAAQAIPAPTPPTDD